MTFSTTSIRKVTEKSRETLCLTKSHQSSVIHLETNSVAIIPALTNTNTEAAKIVKSRASRFIMRINDR